MRRGKLVLGRRSLVAGSAVASLAAMSPAIVWAQETPGVTETEIRIGSTTSLSGPVSALGTQARCQEAFFKRINDKGGIAGRKINYIYYDDGFSPPKTVEQVRRRIEQVRVQLQAERFIGVQHVPPASSLKFDPRIHGLVQQVADQVHDDDQRGQDDRGAHEKVIKSLSLAF